MLKKFPVGMFESHSSGYGNNDPNSDCAKFGRDHRMSQQVVELPIEHQAIDMIAAEGEKGLTLKEVSRLNQYPIFTNHQIIFNNVAVLFYFYSLTCIMYYFLLTKKISHFYKLFSIMLLSFFILIH